MPAISFCAFICMTNVVSLCGRVKMKGKIIVSCVIDVSNYTREMKNEKYRKWKKRERQLVLKKSIL